MGYSLIHVDGVEQAGPGGAGPGCMTMIGIGARTGSREPRGPF